MTEPVNNLNPFDPAALRLDQSFAEGAGVKTLLTTVPVRKPKRHEFIRVNPDQAYQLSPAAFIEVKDGHDEIYLVAPNLAPELADELYYATIFLAINRQGVAFLWPVRLPDSDGKYNSWHRSAADAADLAMKQWVRLKSNRPLGAYEMSVPTASYPEPEWPALEFGKVLEIGFRDRLVNSVDHPVIKQLRGRA